MRTLDQLCQQVIPREQQTPEALAALLKAETEKWPPRIRMEPDPDRGLRGNLPEPDDDASATFNGSGFAPVVG
jgi:hypothetical protein